MHQSYAFFLDLLDFCNFRSWFVHPCILPVYLGVSSFIINESLLLIKKKIYIYILLVLGRMYRLSSLWWASDGSSFRSILILRLSVRLDWDYKSKLFHYSTYFCYYLWVSLHFLALFMGPTILLQLTFTFIYSIFSNNFSVSTK